MLGLQPYSDSLARWQPTRRWQLRNVGNRNMKAQAAFTAGMFGMAA